MNEGAETNKRVIGTSEKAVADVVDRHRLLSVTFLVETYGDLYINAILERNPRMTPHSEHKLSVMGMAGNFVEAVERAEQMLIKVNILETTLGCAIEPPDPKDQPFEDGYSRRLVKDDIEVEFKRKDGRFVITNIKRRDKDGFYIHEKPLPIQGKMKFVSKMEGDLELWEWDDIGILCGTAGECVVRDGMIIKSRTTRMS